MLENFNFLDINDYRKLKIIGKGTYGSIFRIQEKSTGKILVAKIFKEIYNKYENEEDEINLKQINTEASIYLQLQHPAIATFYGISPSDFDNEPYPCLILEYYPNKSLESIIINENKNQKPPNFNNTKKLINLYGIASAVAYLHSKNIIYRDLKPGNVLEDENFYPKLSDFGFSKKVENKSSKSTLVVGSPLYMAPELYENDGYYSNSVDVYSFSILAYQLIVQETVFDKKISFFCLMSKISKGERPEFTKPIPNCYKNLISKCWSQDPKDRPTFPEIVEILKNNREFITEFDVDENEFYSYIKIISGEIPLPQQPIKEQLVEIIEDEDDKPLSIHVESVDLSILNRKKRIGEGSFGVVYEVESKNDKMIYAAKISKSEIYECLKKEIETVNFIREVTILSQIKHPSIMKFIGFSPINFKNTPKPVIITELLQNGTLEDVIELERKGLSNEQWNETKKLINIYGIASAMAYLHELNIIHRDLKPANILIDDFLFPKLADFGLSKDLSCDLEECEQLKQTGLVGTPIYIAPEIYNQSNYTKAGDVYAFGLIVYEIITSDAPSIGTERYQLMCNVMNGVRPSFNCQIPECYKQLIENCWDQNPTKRPSFDEIVDDLKNNPEFVTDLVDEDEYLRYVDMIDNKISTSKNFQKINIFNQPQNGEENKKQNISNGKGFINIDDFIKLKKNGKNEYWKFYNVTNKVTNDFFTAKMSIISIPNFTKEEISNIINEVRILSTLNHPSLLKFYGYSSINFKHESKPIIITETFLKQTLENIIEMNRKDIKSKEWNSTQILINIYGIASAMAYLHSKNILHNNLKPKNIFIDKNMRPKLTDYGFYTKLQILNSMSCQSSSRMQNVPNYSAPEILISKEATKASDVYSFAMIMFEMLTKEKPFNHLKTTNEILIEVVSKCGRPNFPEESNEKVADCFKEMIELCWSQEPNERMTFDDIVYTLKNDPRFVENDVDKEKFFSYVEMIDNKKEIESQRKIEENEPQKINENDEENVEEEKVLNLSSTSNSKHQSEGSKQWQQQSNLILQHDSEESNQLQQQSSLIQQQVSEGANSQDSLLNQIHDLNVSTIKLDQQMSRKQKVKPISYSQNSTATKVLVSENDDSPLSTSYNEIRNDKCSTNWILVNFDSSTKKWIFFGKGSGGQEEMEKSISPDFIGYCYLRVELKNREINRPFFILIKYVPVGTKIMTKAHMNTRRGEIESIFDYRNIEIEVESKDDISEAINQNIK